jgi:putative FmdB family regulatory protein
MPIYEYQCKNCGVFEVTQRIVEDALKECPTCHGADLHRLISHTSFVLKGSGWYATGYASKSSTKSDNADGSPSSATPAASSDGSSNGTASSGDSSSAPSSDASAKSSSDKAASPKTAA